MSESPAYSWEVVAQSVRGASHHRSGAPNQDAVTFRTGPGGLPPVVLAVSDGHGSAKSFRSDSGAQLAVRLAADLAERLLSEQRDVARLKSIAERQLPSEIVKQWRVGVQEHALQNPLTGEETDLFEREIGPAAKTADHASWVPVAYGATLLLIAIGDGFAFYLQLGDGDILAASETTGAPAIEVHHPLPPDETLIANETTSLSMDGAQRRFRFGFRIFRGQPPVLMLASTDGYSNSFTTPADFERVASDLVLLIEREGLGYVESHLDDWLTEASRSGSGDDVTVGLIHRKGRPSTARAGAPATTSTPIVNATDSNQAGMQEGDSI